MLMTGCYHQGATSINLTFGRVCDRGRSSEYECSFVPGDTKPFRSTGGLRTIIAAADHQFHLQDVLVNVRAVRPGSINARLGFRHSPNARPRNPTQMLSDSKDSRWTKRMGFSDGKIDPARLRVHLLFKRLLRITRVLQKVAI